MSLPELLVFSVNDTTLGARYLSFTGPQRQLRCGHEQGLLSDLTSFVVEPAQNGLVHIRSRYENRFWVRPSRVEPWLLSSAPDPVEDLLEEGCTLFRPRLAAGNVSVSFVHVQSGLNVTMRPETDADAYNLCVELAAPTDFNFINPSSFIKLPKYVAIKGDNDTYLYQRSPFTTSPDVLSFGTGSVLAILPTHTKNGRDIRFKTTGRYDRFVRAVVPHHQIQVLHPQNPELELDDPRLLFEVVRSSPSGTNEAGIALRSRVNNLFCQREGINLVAKATSQQNQAAWLRPMDPMQSRLVTVTSFRHARVTRATNVVMTRPLYNPDDRDLDVPITTPYTDIRTRTWNHSFIPLLQRTVGIFNAHIPFVTPTGQLEFPDESSYVFGVWIERMNLSKQETYRTRIIVPPKTRVKFSLIQHVATCHVPFSYQQQDIFTEHRMYRHDHDDGLFIGEYSYHLEEKIETLTEEEYEAQVGMEQDLSSNQSFETVGDMKPDASDDDDSIQRILEVFRHAQEAEKCSNAEEDVNNPDVVSDQGSESQGGIKPETDASDRVNNEAV